MNEIPVKEEELEIREESLQGTPPILEGPVYSRNIDVPEARVRKLYDSINAGFQEGMQLGMDISKYRKEYEVGIIFFKSNDYYNAEIKFIPVNETLIRELKILRFPVLESSEEIRPLPLGYLPPPPPD